MKKLNLTSIAVTFTDWFSSMAILNLSWLLFSLPLFTLIPATDAVFEVIHDWKQNGKPENIFTLFEKCFKDNFKQSFKLGGPLFITLLIIVMDLYFLNYFILPRPWFQIFKYAFYILTLLIFLTILYIYPLAKTKKSFNLPLFLIAFMLVVGKPKVTFSLLLLLIFFYFLFTWFPAMLFFISMSGLAWLSETALENALQ